MNKVSLGIMNRFGDPGRHERSVYVLVHKSLVCHFGFVIAESDFQVVVLLTLIDIRVRLILDNYVKRFCTSAWLSTTPDLMALELTLTTNVTVYAPGATFFSVQVTVWESRS